MTVPFALAFAVLLAFFVLEGRFRQDAAARSVARTAADRGTVRQIGGAFAIAGLAFVLSPLLLDAGIAALPDAVRWAGVGLAIAGLVTRLWSAAVLGRFYSRTVALASEHRLVRAGPYRFVRHPGYAGAICLWIGAGLAGGSGIATAAIALVTLLAYRRRIRVEEEFLRDAFGAEYVAYAKTTCRLVPFVY